MKARVLVFLLLGAGLAAVLTREPLAVAAAAVATSFWVSQADLSRVAGFPSALVVRRLIRVGLPLVWLPLAPAPTLGVDWTVAAGAGFALLLMVPAWRDLRYMLSSELIASLDPVSRQDKARDVFALATVGAVQELVYRHLVMVALAPYSVPLAVVASSVLFAAEHLTADDWRTRFDGIDVGVHLVMGVGFASLWAVSGSVLGPLLGHTVYNAPALYQALRQPTAGRHRPTLDKETDDQHVGP